MVLASTSRNSPRSRTRTGNGNNCKNQQHSQQSRRNRKTHIYVSTNNNDEEECVITTMAEKPSQHYHHHHHMNTNTLANGEREAQVVEALYTTKAKATTATQYKWTRQFGSAIQSAFEFLAKLVATTVIFLWSWTSSAVLHYLRTSENNLFKEVWNYILATMTIEIVTTTVSTETNNSNNCNGEVSPNSDSTQSVTTLTSCVPVLRLNSVTMDEAVEESESDRHHMAKDLLLLEDEEDKIDAGIDCGSDFIQSNSSNYNSSDGEQDTIVFTDDENASALTTSLASTLELLEKQSQSHHQQLYASRRDSDSSCDGSGISGPENKNDETNANTSADDLDGLGTEIKSTEDVDTRIIRQVESMFSDDHLAKDGFLLKHVRRRSDGYVSLRLVAGLRKVKQISKDFNTVVEALRKADKIEVNADGTKIRRVDPLTPALKSLPIVSSNKDKDKGNANESNGQKSRGRNSMEQQQLSDSELAKCMRTGGQMYNNNNNNNGYQRRSQRYSNASMTSSGSSASPASSVCSSRNSSFSYQPHPGGDLFNRNHYYGSGAELDGLEQQVLLRRRGASLPMAVQQQHLHHQHPHAQQKRHSHSSAIGNHHGYLSPSSSPPSGAAGAHRPKSNSYCEGANIANGAATGGMSMWLQKRIASTRTSEGNISLAAAVIRQPRGPDGTKGFAAGYRKMIAEERQVRERKMGQQMV